MSGAGFSFAMLASFKSNRDAIKNKNRFHKRAKGLKTTTSILTIANTLQKLNS